MAVFSPEVVDFYRGAVEAVIDYELKLQVFDELSTSSNTHLKKFLSTPIIVADIPYDDIEDGVSIIRSKFRRMLYDMFIDSNGMIPVELDKYVDYSKLLINNIISPINSYRIKQWFKVGYILVQSTIEESLPICAISKDRGMQTYVFSDSNVYFSDDVHDSRDVFPITESVMFSGESPVTPYNVSTDDLVVFPFNDVWVRGHVTGNQVITTGDFNKFKVFYDDAVQILDGNFKDLTKRLIEHSRV